MQNASQLQTLEFQKNSMNDMLKQANEMAKMIDQMQRMYGQMQQLTNQTHHMVGETRDLAVITEELRDHIADFEDFWRPIRSYGGTFIGRIVWAVGARLAVCSGCQVALDGAGDVCNHRFGSRVSLQPVVGIPV
jgi:hypothetical protein